MHQKGHMIQQLREHLKTERATQLRLTAEVSVLQKTERNTPQTCCPDLHGR